MGCHFLLQGIFPTQELNPGLPHCWQMPYHHLRHQGSLKTLLFQNSVSFAAKLRGMYKDLPYTLCPYTCTTFSATNISLIVHSVDLEKCIILYIHHYGITRSIFSLPSNSSVLCLFSLYHITLGNY